MKLSAKQLNAISIATAVMEAYYSITNRDLTIYNKYGICVGRVYTPFDMNEVAKKWNIPDENIHIAL